MASNRPESEQEVINLDKKYTEKTVTYAGVPTDKGGLEPTKFLARIKRREQQYKGDYDNLLKVHKSNRNYWAGKQIREDDLYEGESPIIVNRIFQSVETIIPIITRKTPDPSVTIMPRSKKNQELKEKVERHFKDLWEVECLMQGKMEKSARNLLTSKYAMGKAYWNEDLQKIDYCIIPPGKTLFPLDVTTLDEAPFIIEYVTDSYGNIIEKWPDKEAELKGAMTEFNEINEDTQITYIEYWEDDFVAYKYKDVLFGVENNPYYNWDNEDQNHFKEAKKPYFIWSFLNFGDSLIDDTSLVDQVKTLQDSINKRKRQIELNADMANGQLVVAGGKMDKSTFDKIQNTPQEKIYLENADSVNDAITKMTGRAFDQGIMQDMNDTALAVDNIMGTHATTRGEKESQETATGRAILKESDYGRLELIQRNYESFVQNIFDYFLQIIYVKYNKETQVFSLPGNLDDNEISEVERENYLINTEFFGTVTRVLVQKDSTVPRDKMVEKAEAVDLAKSGLMATVDMYRRLEYPNPEQLARNAMLQQTDPMTLFSEIQQGDKTSLDAIKYIKAVLNGQVLDGSAPENMYQSQVPEEYANYVNTLGMYRKGIELDSDLIPYEDITDLTKQIIDDHIRMSAQTADQLLQQQQALLQQSGIAPDPQAVGAPVQDPAQALAQQAAPAPPAGPAQQLV